MEELCNYIMNGNTCISEFIAWWICAWNSISCAKIKCNVHIALHAAFLLECKAFLASPYQPNWNVVSS